MGQIIEFYQRIVQLPKINQIASCMFKAALGILFVFFLLPDVPDVICDKVLVVINSNYTQYIDYIKEFTMPLISWLIKINYKLICLIVILWITQQIFVQFSITDVLKYPIKILLSSSLIISCAILVAPIIYIISINGLKFREKAHDILAFYNAISSYHDLVVACIPFFLACYCFVEFLYDESQREYLEWKNKFD